MFIHVGVTLKNIQTGELVEVAKQMHPTGGKYFLVGQSDYGRWYTEKEVEEKFEEV